MQPNGSQTSLTPARSRPASSTRKIGKKAAGRLLDGIEHNGFPS